MKQVKVGDFIAIQDLAEKLQVPVVQIMGVLLKNGMMATINDSIDFDTAAIIAVDFDTELTKEAAKSAQIASPQVEFGDRQLQPRPPVVTIMGHVDHGKTTLLDFIRHSNVAGSETGGITQNITSYQVTIDVEKKPRTITFIDTPGHKAFAKMREHGSGITDIIVLVVAANDGVKPQTEEIIEHIKKNNVPVIVAINKIDTPDANADNVRRQLGERDIVAEEWGGKVPMVPISAKSGEGVEQLLEIIALQADVMELKAPVTGMPSGVVIESHQQKGLGPVALALVTSGTLKINDYLLLGASWAKVKKIESTLGQNITEAGPATPVRIAGLRDLPEFGDRFSGVNSEKEAKATLLNQSKTFSQIIKSIEKDEDRKVLKFIVKAETQGTLEALTASITALEHHQVKITLVKVGIGAISDSDADLAASTGATLVAFRTSTAPAAVKIIENKKVPLISSDIIYEILEEIERILDGLIEVEYDRIVVGRFKILEIFYVKGSRMVIGGEVVWGKATAGLKFDIEASADNTITGTIESVQIEKNKTDEVTEGHQCGLSVVIDAKVTKDAIIELYRLEPKKMR